MGPRPKIEVKMETLLKILQKIPGVKIPCPPPLQDRNLKVFKKFAQAKLVWAKPRYCSPHGANKRLSTDEQNISAHLTSSKQTAEQQKQLSLKRKMEEDWGLEIEIRPRLKRLREAIEDRKIKERRQNRLEEIGYLSGLDGEDLEKIESDELCDALGSEESGEPGGFMLNQWTTQHLQQDSTSIEIGTCPKVDLH